MVKQRIVEISILETTTDEHFERILSLIRILEGTCGAREIKRTEEKELNKIIDALTCNYKLTDAYKKEHNVAEVSLEIEQAINESTKVKINITGYDQKHAVSVAHDMLADIKNRDNVIIIPKTE